MLTTPTDSNIYFKQDNTKGFTDLYMIISRYLPPLFPKLIYKCGSFGSINVCIYIPQWSSINFLGTPSSIPTLMTGFPRSGRIVWAGKAETVSHVEENLGRVIDAYANVHIRYHDQTEKVEASSFGPMNDTHLQTSPGKVPLQTRAHR